MLVNKDIWLSKPRLFNDPFDCKLELSDEIDAGEYVETVERLLLKHFGTVGIFDGTLAGKDAVVEGFKSFLELYSNHIGIFSMSSVPTSILMWSHYAANHTGFCVELELDSTIDEMEGLHLLEVDYERHPDTSLWQAMEDWVDQSGLSKLGIQSLLGHKSKEWNYEEEWRLCILLGPEGDGRIVNLPGRISRIAFGLKMGHAERITTMNCLKSEDVEFYEAVRRPNSFDLCLSPFPWPHHLTEESTE